MGAFEVESGDIFAQTDADLQADFMAYLQDIDSPATTWDAWLALCQTGSPVSFPEAGDARPTHHEGFQPTPDEVSTANDLFRSTGSACYSVVSRPRPNHKPSRKVAYPGGTGIREEDIYPVGCWS